MTSNIPLAKEPGAHQPLTPFASPGSLLHELDGWRRERLPLAIQVLRLRAHMDNLDGDLRKYQLLLDLQVHDEALFYAALMSDSAYCMPLIYTPTVGEACQSFSCVPSSRRGLCLSIAGRGRLRETLSAWPQKDIRFIVVTDGERILGLGDLGVCGFGIPVGKLALYTACAGIPPHMALPVILDVGTDNESLLNDPRYPGLRRKRIRGPAYDEFLDEFVHAAQCLFPKCCIQWEDFASGNAVKLLSRYRDGVCSFNDDIQGTASVALAGILGALRINGGKLTRQRILFLGGGAAATGIAGLIGNAMAMDGLSLAEARARNWLFDINGLVVASRSDIADFQRPFAHRREPINCFLEAIEKLRPTCIIGVSTVPKLFDKQVVEAMARINERPIIFPYSNPTSRAECAAEDAYRWSGGRAIFASGSPFPPVDLDGRRFIPGQGNNVYVFPAMGMAILATDAMRVTDDMFIVAAKAIAKQVSAENLASGLVYPPQSRICEASLNVAAEIAEFIFDNGFARAPRPASISERIRDISYQPEKIRRCAGR